MKKQSLIYFKTLCSLMISGVTFMAIATTTSCVKSDVPPFEQPPLYAFDWKTTKQVDLKINSEDGVATAFRIYDDRGNMVLAGFTPFNDKVTIPKSAGIIHVSSAPMPLDFNYKGSRAAAGDIGGNIKSISTSSPSTVTLSPEAHLNMHNFLASTAVTLLDQTKKSWPYMVEWWNLRQTSRSSIQLYEERAPTKVNGVYDIPHTCTWDKCKYNSNVTEPETIAGTTYGTYLFEDLFPYLGDYDMNDVVIEEAKAIDVDKNNKVASISYTFNVNAIGSTMSIGLALYLPNIEIQHIKAVELSKYNPATGRYTKYECDDDNNLFNIDDNMEEPLSNKNKEMVVPIFSNSEIFYNTGYMNTQPGTTTAPKLSFKVEIDIQSRNYTIEDCASSLFLLPKYKDDTNPRGREIHVVDHPVTSHMNIKLFRTGVDDSDPLTFKRTYRAKNGYVWGMYLPIKGFRHPFETVDLSVAYPDFVNWTKSLGASYNDWYLRPVEGKVWTW